MVFTLLQGCLPYSNSRILRIVHTMEHTKQKCVKGRERENRKTQKSSSREEEEKKGENVCIKNDVKNVIEGERVASKRMRRVEV